MLQTESLTPKKRVVRVLTHQPVDHLPTQINYTASMADLLSQYFSVDIDVLPEYLGNHLVRVDLDVPNRLSRDGKVRFDWWGVGFSTEEEGYYTSVNPLSDSKDLDEYTWPDPHQPELVNKAKTIIEEKGEVCFIVPNFGFALFERAWSLRGFENFFLDMVMDQSFTEELFDRITEIQLTLIHRFIDLGVDGGYFGDDYGAQKGLLFSPEMWRKYIKPQLAKLFAPFIEKGLPVIMHSDGQIQQILPDLVEIGLMAINPVQPEVLDHEKLYQDFVGKLAFYGGISTQTVLPNGSPREVQLAIRAAMDKLAPEGTGMILAPSHRMMSDIPMENVGTMLEIFQSIRE